MLTPPPRATTFRAQPAAGRVPSPVEPAGWKGPVGRRGTAPAPLESAGERRGRDPTCRPLPRAKTEPLLIAGKPGLGARGVAAPLTARPASPAPEGLCGSPKFESFAGPWPWQVSPASSGPRRRFEAPLPGVPAISAGVTQRRFGGASGPASPVQTDRRRASEASADDDAHEICWPFDAWESADEPVAASAHGSSYLLVPEIPELHFVRRRPLASTTGRPEWTATSSRGAASVTQTRLRPVPDCEQESSTSSRQRAPMLLFSPLGSSVCK